MPSHHQSPRHLDAQSAKCLWPSKPKNTPYCPDHKRLMDSLCRQAKGEKAETHKEVLAIVKKQGEGLRRLVRRFEAACGSVGKGQQRPKFQFTTFIQSERNYLQVGQLALTTPRSRRQWMSYATCIKYFDYTEEDRRNGHDMLRN